MKPHVLCLSCLSSEVRPKIPLRLHQERVDIEVVEVAYHTQKACKLPVKTHYLPTRMTEEHEKEEMS